jgi:hypothetical protein
MVQLEQDSTDRAATRNVRKVLRPVIRVLDDYSSVVETMGKLNIIKKAFKRAHLTLLYAAQADPMPTAIIWGSLKVVIEVSASPSNIICL